MALANLQPLDRTKREHVGTFDRLIWSSREDQHIIAVLTDERVIAGPGDPDWFVRGQQYRFFGKWEESDRGPRFRFQTCVRDVPHSRNAVIKYLSDVAPNVGQKTASRLWDRYGSDAVRTLREEPGRVSEDGVMSLSNAVEASQALVEGAATERTRIDLFDLLGGRGFHGKLITAAIKKWKVNAPETIRKNPFRLMTAKLPSAGFKRCDKLWVDLRLPKHALKRQALCAWNIIRTNRDGHTWHKAEDVADELKKQIESKECQPKKALRLALRARLLAKHKDTAGQVWLAETAKAQSEQRVADNIKRLLRSSGPILWPEVKGAGPDGLPSDHQSEKYRQATLAAVGCFCGGPGTGKTTTLSFALQQIIDQWGERSVAVCSPTGKASVRCTQAMQARGLRLRATTIHTLLGIGRNGHDGDGWDFNHGIGNPLPYRFVVVDEMSMVDTTLLASLLDACPDGTHVLMIGDPGQLAPVGHGAPFRDIIAASIPTGELTQVRRNAGMIVHACLRIKNGEQFDTCSKIDLDAQPPQNLRLIEADSPQAAADTLEAVLSSMRSFHPVKQTQVLTPLNRRSLLSRVVLNQRLQPMLNPDGRAVAGNPFRIGDKIICLQNSWMQAVELADDALEPTEADNYRTVQTYSVEGGDQPQEQYVANGEIGFVEAISAKATIARFSESETLIKIPMKVKSNRVSDDAAGGSADSTDDGDGGGDDSDEKGQGGNFDLAYAVSGHKSQGSEWPCVIVLADDQAGMVATREWWYTVVSRGAKLTILIGSKGTLLKQAKRQSLVRRKTMLVELLAAKAAEKSQ